ncbi:MAG: hypothetical protein CME81_06040 [Halomonas sp.]|nr:hypothetical protein [Halomonas sp.]|tara:strand:+ start:4627 stop:5397 length:771 start_codon:yes stop_codon:yes gene_type:complete
MKESFDGKQISKTFMKGLQVFSAFDGVNKELTVPEVSKKTGIDRTVTRRLILTLESMGYLESRSPRRYQLTPKILGLASYFLRGRGIGKYVDPILRTFSHKLGESISFAMIDDLEAIYVAHSPGEPSMITHGFTVGFRLPLAATAIGRALLAFSAPKEYNYLLENVPLKIFTAKTKTKRKELEACLKEVRSQGYSMVTDEYELGVTSLSVPVLSSDKKLIGALGVAGPSPRFKEESEVERRVSLLFECAEAMSFIS